MKNFMRGNRGGSSRGDKRQDFGDRGGSRPGMHQAICSECGKECEVPFRPTGDRPVFCSTCFEKHGNTGGNRPQGKNFQRGGFDNKRMFEAVCAKCGNKCEVPFRPTGGKPVYCSNCFEKGDKTSGKAPDQFKQQFEILNSKLDQILKALGPASAGKEKITAVKKAKAGKTLVKAVLKKVKTKKK